MKPKHGMMAAGLAASAWLAFFGDTSPNVEVVTSVTRHEKSQESAPVSPPSDVTRHTTTDTNLPNLVISDSATEAGKGTQAGTSQILALSPRTTSLAEADNDENAPTLFASHSWTPPPKPIKKEAPLPPSAPPMPYVYIGKQQAAGSFEVFLARGEQTYIAREKAVIDNTYRIDSIKPPTLTLTYLPLNQVQQISIGATD